MQRSAGLTRCRDGVETRHRRTRERCPRQESRCLKHMRIVFLLQHQRCRCAVCSCAKTSQGRHTDAVHDFDVTNLERLEQAGDLHSGDVCEVGIARRVERSCLFSSTWNEGDVRASLPLYSWAQPIGIACPPELSNAQITIAVPITKQMLSRSVVLATNKRTKFQHQNISRFVHFKSRASLTMHFACQKRLLRPEKCKRGAMMTRFELARPKAVDCRIRIFESTVLTTLPHHRNYSSIL